MFCSNCGTPGAGGVCASCGAMFAEGPITPLRHASPVSSELKWGVFVATLIIPLIGIIMGGVYLADAQAPKKTVGRLWLFTGIGMAVLYATQLMR